MMVKNFTRTETSSPFQKFFCLSVLVFLAFFFFFGKILYSFNHVTLYSLLGSCNVLGDQVFGFQFSKFKNHGVYIEASIFFEISLTQRSLLSSISAFVFIFLLTGVLVVLDAHPGGIIYRDLIPEYVNYARTIYEGFPATLSE